MNIALWISQGVLAAVFALSGTLKSTQPKERMIATGQTGVVFFPLPVIRTVAALELAGAAGLILPRITGIAEPLTPAAAIGLAVVMVGAAISHSRLREPGAVAANLVLLALCVFVAFGRLA
ncbi:DoxX family protein [Lentzea tibetensis]|uniref:DoxX family protein n=1 Tax=Lentzea tibetensis TaxID=2591470 RepID=A0A563ESN4_9PSEU|nr:DoxX family protein [Lentzea tibetensis]TWP50154.1 DoxX family protein [Lentzea tibetensis]